MRYFCLIILISILMTGGAAGLDDLSEEDLAVIEMLEFLETMDLIEDSDFELLEQITETGDDHGS